MIAWLGRAGGVAILAALAVIWASLLTWSVADPSLSHVTGGQARNMVGPFGAIVSDLLLQTLGFAAVLALLPPMFWGLELAFSERLQQAGTRIGFFLLAVLAFAAAFSALPLLDGWPLHHGLGGFLGDALFNLGSSIFSLLNPERASLATGLMFLVGGCGTLTYSIGWELAGLADMISPARAAQSLGKRTAGWWSQLQDRGLDDQSPASGLRADIDVGRARGRFRAGAWAEHAAEPELSIEDAEPGFQWRSSRRLADGRVADHAGSAVPTGIPGSRSVPDLHSGAPWSGEDELTGDLLPDDASRAIAERFAPASAERGAFGRQRSHRPARLTGQAFSRPEPHYNRPSLNLLKRPAASKAAPEVAQTVLRGSARLLEDVLGDFGVKGEVREIKPGPVVTLFELEPARGTKSSRVIGLADDIARSMSVTSVRVAVVPGRNAIGIELPNARRETVLLREILESEAFRASNAALPLALGKSIGGEPVVADLARMPHLLIAGTTGSGKSVGVNAMILSLLYRHSPDDCRFLMIDPKMLELSVYNGIPHLLTPVVTDPHKAVAALGWVVSEMEERYKRMAKLAVRNIDVFNERVRNAKKRGEPMSRTVQTGFDRATGQAIYEKEEMDLEPMPYIVVVVDEFADLMIVAGKEIEAVVQRLAQMARAAGIHLIMATQRPSVDVITGTIKANFPTRISFKVTSRIDSRTILNEQGAEQLLGQGDMLYSSGSGHAVRVHGPFVLDEEVETIAQAVRQQGEPRYIEGITEAQDASAGAAGAELQGSTEDDIFDRAVAIVLRDRKASTSYLQRRLSIGYNRAADLIERMEREGIVSRANNVGKRDILLAGLTGPVEAD